MHTHWWRQKIYISYPAVKESIFTFQDSNESRYGYEHSIDVLDPTPVGRPPIRRMINTMHSDNETFNFVTKRQSATIWKGIIIQDSNNLTHFNFYSSKCLKTLTLAGTLIPCNAILKYSPSESFDTAETDEAYSTLSITALQSGVNSLILITTITLVLVLAVCLFLRFKSRQTEFDIENNNNLLFKPAFDAEEIPEQKVETSECSTASGSVDFDLAEKLPEISSRED